MKEENRNKAFALGAREYGCDLSETNRYLAIFRDANYYAGYLYKETGKYYWCTDSGDNMEVKPEDLWAPIPLV